MKISANTLQSVTQFRGKDHPVSQKQKGEGARDLPEAANPAERQARETAPPGLQRVLERLQSTPAAELSRGQAHAQSMISRNIARYLEVQSMGEAPPAVPVPAEPVAVDPASAVPVPAEPVAVDPASAAPVPAPVEPVPVPVPESPATSEVVPAPVVSASPEAQQEPQVS